jgi:3-oxoacyl-[acyl-carrier protein] reductase
MGLLTGRHALVTGGHGGLGSVAVRVLLDLDAEDVLVVGRSLERLNAFRDAAGERVSVEALDVTDPGAWGALADRRVDVLIPCAGTAVRAPFVETDHDVWASQIDTNLTGTLFAVRAVLPGMLERGWGRIVLISSVAASIGLPGRAVYGATKAALESFARAIATEVGDRGVLVNCLAPGMFPTEMTQGWLRANPEVGEAIRNRIPLGRFGATDELASAFRFVLETTYAQGSVVHVDGGWGIQ